MLLSLHLTQNYVINGKEKIMRLIDVDVLKKCATKVMFRDAPECGEFDAVAVDDIDCIPTIDPETLRSTQKYAVYGENIRMTQLQEAIRDKITKYSDACGMCTDTTKECDACGITCILEELNELQKLANNQDFGGIEDPPEEPHD